MRRLVPALVLVTALLPACGGDDVNANTTDAAALEASDDAAGDATTDASPDSTNADGPIGPPPDVLQPMDPCNGDPASCAKTYDAVSYPTAHAAMAYAFPPFACPAQTHPVRMQLDQGIRALDLEVHTSTDLGDGGSTLALCLSTCAAGELRIDVALSDVAAFLAVNPREIVTLLFSGGADAGQLASAIEAAGLDHDALAQSMGNPWPTLHAMIVAGTRVVVLADVTGTTPAWVLPLWTYVRETGRAFTSPAAMTCDIARGAAMAPLFMLNEFLVDGEGGTATGIDAGADASGPLAPGCDAPTLAHFVNAEPFFMNRVTACVQQRGVKPTFVAVDDYDDGDVSGVVRALNR